MRPRYSRQGPGEGPNHDWENDHTFVKVSGRGAGGVCTWVKDNVKASCTLGLHRHDSHAGIFCFPEGRVGFLVDGGSR